MTAQIDDDFDYHGATYAVAGISEGALFAPEEFGLQPVSTRSDCWRGWQAEYALDGPCLMLDVLSANLEQGRSGQDPPPVLSLNGVAPIQRLRDLAHVKADERRVKRLLDLHSVFSHHFVGLALRLEYTGGLLLARGFIHDLYVHMGFQSPWKYENVVELVFERGVLQRECDRSAAMADLRTMILAQSEEVGPAHDAAGDSIRQFIERAFDRSY